VRAAATHLVARGTQQSILAYRIGKRCLACDGPPPPVDGSATLDREQPGNA
jgi:hypothetical protein